jgi:hypothetical protein
MSKEKLRLHTAGKRVILLDREARGAGGEWMQKPAGYCRQAVGTSDADTIRPLSSGSSLRVQ